MKSETRPRFDTEALRDLAGDKSYARGEKYFRDGQVRILAIEKNRVLAQVAGTEDYRTELTGRGKGIGGECSCPAFEDRGFCKHMVAVALAANAAGDDGAAEGLGAIAVIRGHLKGMGIDALVAMIVDLAERDPVLFDKLDTAAAVAGADDKTLEARLRKVIDSATRTGGFIEYRNVPSWAAGVDTALEALAGIASGPRARLALLLAERAIDRIERAIEDVDDSDGHCSALLESARDIHFTAAKASRPEPVQFARDLFQRETTGEYAAFECAVADYAGVLGKKGLAEYRRLAKEAWDKIPPRHGNARNKQDPPPNYHQLKSIVDFFAERDGDTEARIALRAKDLASPWSYHELADFCLSQGRESDALRWAEEGLWIFEDGRLDERLVIFTAGLLSKAGRKPDAEAHVWRAFEKAPSLELHAWLGKLGGPAARERSLTFLEARLVREKPSSWYHPADLLINVLTQEKKFDAAWAAVGKHGASMGAKEALARKSEKAHPREALETYTARVEELAALGGNSAYEQAAEFIKRMAALRSAEQQSAYVKLLKARMMRKRNFIKLLE